MCCTYCKVLLGPERRCSICLKGKVMFFRCVAPANQLAVIRLGRVRRSAGQSGTQRRSITSNIITYYLGT